jgi:hypothetical protein
LTLFSTSATTLPAERFWSEDYMQHSAHIPPGRGGLFGLIKSLPEEYAYELGLIMEEDDMVMHAVGSAAVGQCDHQGSS